MNQAEVLMDLHDVMEQLEAMADAERASVAQKYFKTGPGDYAEGDRFRGIRMPTLRSFARKLDPLPMESVIELLHSAFHEDRMVALLLLIRRYGQADETGRNSIFNLYLANTAHHINNWDLVDVSAPLIVGQHLLERHRSPLYTLATSTVLWERRIAIVATFCFIRQDDYTDTLILAAMLLQDKEDLLHKATGWMLREVGKRNQQQLEAFLHQHHANMPRVMLRYAIERFPASLRKAWLNGTMRENGSSLTNE